jgi:predicted secreted hydrolase
MRRPGRGLSALAAVAVLVAAGCSAPILANPPLVFSSPQAPSPAPSLAVDPVPITFPLDDGPHRRLTEWWYYTGHLHTAEGRRFGFEVVIFRAERGSIPPSWAAHLALTDEEGNAFHYAQRSEIGGQVDRSPRDAGGEPAGFDLQIAGLNPELIASGAPATGAPWRLAGASGSDRIDAVLTNEEAAAAGASFGLQLDLGSTKAAALHDGDGFVDFGPGGSSYYYSRTRLTAAGTLELDGEQLAVDGIAWFDHQWGDFVSVGGGWDWFAVNLDDGTDITLSIVHAPDGRDALQYGTVVEADGTVRHLPGEAFGATATGVLPSVAEGRLYPSDWTITIPDYRDGVPLRVNLMPTVPDQELDARPTTGVIYWEGSQRVLATLGLTNLTTIRGDGYVEMTRY